MPAKERPRIVVVGGGIAGQTLCEVLREREDDADITLLCGGRTGRMTG